MITKVAVCKNKDEINVNESQRVKQWNRWRVKNKIEDEMKVKTSKMLIVEEWVNWLNEYREKHECKRVEMNEW
jgi:hypothetical protein